MVKLLQNVNLLLVSAKTISKYIEMLFPTNHLLCSNILGITDGFKDQQCFYQETRGKHAVCRWHNAYLPLVSLLVSECIRRT